MKRLLILLCPLLLALSACDNDFEVYDLRCEGLTEPLSIDSGVPHFSWKIRSATPMEQRYYEIEVGPDLWQSGKVASSAQVMVPYGGTPLASRQQAWWRVRVWRQDGKVSRWSEKASFGVGVLEGLKGEFIGAVPGEGRAPLLRRRFTAEKGGEAILYVTSLGYHEVFLNGEKVSEGVLQPAVSQLDKRSLIVSYPLRLEKGGNELLIAAGSGWYKPATFGAVYEGPLVKAELDVDGKPILWTDASWEGAWSGYRDLGTWQAHRFGGEAIVAANEPVWGPVDVVTLEGIVESPQMCPPVKLQETLLPQSITSLGEGRWLLDFGRVVNAMMDITLPALPAGTEVTACFSDFLNPDGSLKPDTAGKDLYIASGAEDRFRNRFNHHLMRYMLLEGLPQEPRKEDCKALRIGDDLAWTGRFESSDPDLNAIYELVQNSVQNLVFGGYMVDCASIERLGYGGDGNASAQTLQSMTDAAPLYLNWLQSWADAQKADGGLPHTAPNPYSAGGGPYWCSFLVQAAWRSYMNYGDPRPLERFYPAMKHWLDYVDAHSSDGFLQRWPDESYRCWFLGDWAAPRGVDVKDPASIDLVAQCTMCQVYADLERIARILGETADAENYRLRLESLKRRTHTRFYHPETATYASGSQLDMVYPLLTGVVPASLRPKVVASLKERTQTLYGGHLATGLVGVPVLAEWSALERETGWMYGLLKQADYPGYLDMIAHGATGVWEEWDGGRSHLHNCYNGIGSWFYEALGGIIPLESGYRRVRIDPQLPDGVDWVRVTQQTPYGPISVYRQGDRVEVELPVGVTAEMGSPEARAREIVSNLSLDEKAVLMLHASGEAGELPVYNWWSEALHGVGRNGKATVFPQPIGMAAAFDEPLLEEVFTAVSDEARVKYRQAKAAGYIGQNQGLTFWTPNINIFRDPRWGRGMETYGEDPYLTGVLGMAVVRGLQGPPDSPVLKTHACAKHFAVHSGPEWNRHSYNARISERDLRETYLPAFKDLVTRANVQEVMMAYNRFRGVPCSASDELINKILRDEWDYKGIVLSDCGAIHNFFAPGEHEYSPDVVHAAAAAVHAGTELNCGDSYRHVPEAVRAGLLDEKDVDRSVERLVAARIRLGELDDIDPWKHLDTSIVEGPEHLALARKMTRESLVLLQNRGGILPLAKDARIALLGPNADDAEMQWGNYNGIPERTSTLADALRERVENLTVLRGCGWVDTLDLKVIEELKDVDIVIFAGGISPRLEGEEMGVSLPGFRGGDRTSLELPEVQRRLIRALKDAGKKVVLANFSGSAIGLVPETESCEAILQCWYPGEEGGEAIAEVLYGDVVPSGKLPVTFYKNVEQLPDFENYDMKGRTYRYFTGEALFPFGFGLSYTQFSYGKARVEGNRLVVPVTNTGACDGEEVVQLYVRRLHDPEGPLKTLRGFKRVAIQKGESVEVCFPLSDATFLWWDARQQDVVPCDGEWELLCGGSSSELQAVPYKR